jgi:hypothetical protein
LPAAPLSLNRQTQQSPLSTLTVSRLPLRYASTPSVLSPIVADIPAGAFFVAMLVAGYSGQEIHSIMRNEIYFNRFGEDSMLNGLMFNVQTYREPLLIPWCL